jgi:hypothetical protein
LLLVGPAEGLAEGHQLVWPWRDRGQVLGQALNPPDVRDPLLLGDTAALRKHVGVGVQADRPLKQMSEAGGKHARTAASIQQPAGPVETQLLRQDGFELG